MVILEKLPETHQDLPNVKDTFNPAPDRSCIGKRVYTGNVPVFQDDRRSLDGVNRGYSCSLSRPFDLHLRPYRQEVAQDFHRRRVEPGGRKPRISGTSVPEPEASLPHRIGEDRSPSDQVAEVLVLRGDFLVIVSPSLLRRQVEERVQPFPSLHFHLLNIFLDFRGFQRQAFRYDEGHTAAYRVRLNPFQVAVSAHLGLFGPFTIDTDRAVLEDKPDLGIAREVLKAHNRVVLPYLLDIPKNFFFPRDIPVDVELPPHIVPHEDRQGLGGTSCRTDWPGVVDLQVLGPVVVPAKAHLGNPLGGCGGDPLGEDCHGAPDGVVEDDLRTPPAEHPGHEVVADPEGCLLP